MKKIKHLAGGWLSIFVAIANTCLSLPAQVTQANFASSESQVRLGSVQVAPAPMETSNSTFQSLNSFCVAQLGSHIASATGVVSYIIVTPNLVHITGEATASLQAGSVSTPAIRTVSATGIARVQLSMDQMLGKRCDFSFTATLPSTEQGSFQNSFFFTNSISYFQFSVVSDSTPVIEEYKTGESGDFTISTNEVTATNNLTANLELYSHSTIGSIGAASPTEVTRRASFVFTMSKPQLTMTSETGHLQIFWPTNFNNYILECNTNLNNQNGWVEVSGGIIISNQFNILTVTIGGDEKAFYRLKH